MQPFPKRWQVKLEDELSGLQLSSTLRKLRAAGVTANHLLSADKDDLGCVIPMKCCVFESCQNHRQIYESTLEAGGADKKDEFVGCVERIADMREDFAAERKRLAMIVAFWARQRSVEKWANAIESVIASFAGLMSHVARACPRMHAYARTDMCAQPTFIAARGLMYSKDP